jgi:hypothetical protein
MANEQPTAKPEIAQPSLTQTPDKVSLQQKSADDLMKRMGSTGDQLSQNTTSNDLAPQLDPSDIGYDPKMIEQIKDPEAKKIVEELKKSLERGFNNKFMKLANDKKEVEQLRKNLEAQTSQPWTPQRVQELLRDPNFAASAASLQQTQPPQDYNGSSEEWSALTPNEKRQFAELRSALNQNQTQLNRMLISQEEQKIKEKYADYDSQQVERWYKDAAEGRIPEGQIRELIHKAMNADKYIERAYKFGLEDYNSSMREKVGAASSPAGINTQTLTDVPKRAEGESSRSLFAKLARMRLANNK